MVTEVHPAQHGK